MARHFPHMDLGPDERRFAATALLEAHLTKCHTILMSYRAKTASTSEQGAEIMGNMRKSIIATLVSSTFLASTVYAGAEEIKIGLLAGFTGPVESIAPGMADAARLAVSEANASKNFMDGATLSLVQADSTCIDASVAVRHQH